MSPLLSKLSLCLKDRFPCRGHRPHRGASEGGEGRIDPPPPSTFLGTQQNLFGKGGGGKAEIAWEEPQMLRGPQPQLGEGGRMSQPHNSLKLCFSQLDFWGLRTAPQTAVGPGGAGAGGRGHEDWGRQTQPEDSRWGVGCLAARARLSCSRNAQNGPRRRSAHPPPLLAVMERTPQRPGVSASTTTCFLSDPTLSPASAFSQGPPQSSGVQAQCDDG